MKRSLIFVLALCAFSSQAAVYQNYYVTNANPTLSIASSNAVLNGFIPRINGGGTNTTLTNGIHFNITNYVGSSVASAMTNRAPYWYPYYDDIPEAGFPLRMHLMDPFWGTPIIQIRHGASPNNGFYLGVGGTNDFVAISVRNRNWDESMDSGARIAFGFDDTRPGFEGFNRGFQYHSSFSNEAKLMFVLKDADHTNFDPKSWAMLTFKYDPWRLVIGTNDLSTPIPIVMAEDTTVEGTFTNSNLSGSGVRLVQADANGKLSAVMATNAAGGGGTSGALTNGDTRNIGLFGEVTVSNVFKVVDAGNTDTPIFTVDIFGGITIGDSKVSLGPYDGIVTATGGFHSRSNVYTLMPTNLASANDVIIATGVSGGDTVHTKYGAASGSGSLTDVQTNGVNLLANATKLNIAAGQNTTIAGSISGTIATVTVGVNTNFDTLNVGTLNLTNPVPLSAGGTGESLSDPNADRILFWDDSAGAVDWLIPGSNLSITDKTLNASGGGASFPMLWGDVGNTTFLDRDDTTEIGGIHFGPTFPGQLAFGVDVGESKMYHASGVAAITTTADGVEYRGSFHNFYSGGDSLAQLTAAHSALYADNGAYAVDLKSGGELEIVSSDFTFRTVGHEVIASDATQVVISNTTAGLAGIKLQDDDVTITGNLNGAAITGNSLTITGASPGLIIATNPANGSFVSIGTNDNLYASNGVTGMTLTLTNGGAHFGSNVVAAKFFGDGSALTGISAGTVTNTDIIYNYGINIEDHFLYGAVNNSAYLGSLFALSVNSGTFSAQTALDTGHPGIVNITTATSANAAPLLLSSAASALLGAGRAADVEFIWRISALSDDTENFHVRLGLHDTVSGSEPTDGVFIRYSNNTNSGNIQLVAMANSVATLTNTATAISASTWYTNRITVNSTATLATLYHNGTVIATLDTGIPDVDSALARSTSLGSFQIVKAAGTTARTLYLDYWKAKH